MRARLSRRVKIEIIPPAEIARSWFKAAGRKVVETGTAALQTASAYSVSARHRANNHLVVQPVRAVDNPKHFVAAVIILALLLAIVIVLPRTSIVPASDKFAVSEPVSDKPAISVSKSDKLAVSSGCGSHGGPGYRLASGKCAGWDVQRNTPIVPVSDKSAVPVPLSESGGCGSHGGPGYRLAGGKCASWNDQRKGRH
jgi:hypothetical protein